MQRYWIAATILSLVPQGARAEPVGTVIFSQRGAQIVNAAGVARPALQGEVVEHGERIVTPANGITQLQLTGGSLVGVRPGSELKIDEKPQSAEGVQQAMSLLRGAVRVIGSELMDQQKPSEITIRTGQATLQVVGADLESVLVRPDTPRVGGAAESGSYSRLTAGTGVIKSGTFAE